MFFDKFAMFSLTVPENFSKDEWIERLLELTKLTPNQVENYLHEIHYHHENEKELVNTLQILKKYFQPEEWI